MAGGIFKLFLFSTYNIRYNFVQNYGLFFTSYIKIIVGLKKKKKNRVLHTLKIKTKGERRG